MGLEAGEGEGAGAEASDGAVLDDGGGIYRIDVTSPVRSTVRVTCTWESGDGDGPVEATVNVVF